VTGPPGPPRIALRGVTRRFGTLTALEEVDLDVAKGEVVVLIGPSGSGKSTLLRCVNALEHPDEGEVLLDGERVDPARKDIEPPSLLPVLMRPTWATTKRGRLCSFARRSASGTSFAQPSMISRLRGQELVAWGKLLHQRMFSTPMWWRTFIVIRSYQPVR